MKDVHGKNRGSAADIEDDLVFEQMLVLHDGIHVGACSDFIFLQHVSSISRPWDMETHKHFFMNAFSNKS